MQRELAEGFLNGTEFRGDTPFHWDQEEPLQVEVSEKKTKIRSKVIGDEDTFKYTCLSYRKAVRKPFFFEVNASGDENTSLDTCVWSVIHAKKR